MKSQGVHMKNAIAVLIACIASVLPQDNIHAGDVLTMDAAIEAAIAANPELAAAGYAYDAQRARPPQAATPPDPRFMVDFDQVPISTADPGNGMVTYMVEQEIPFPSKLAFGHRAEKRAAEAKLSTQEATAQETIRRVKRAYLDVWRMQEEARIERETLAIYRQSKGSAEIAYAVLERPVADPVRASVDMGEVEGQLAIIEQERLVALANLEALIARPLGPTTRVSEPPPAPRVAVLDELITKARDARPEISEAKSMVESEGARVVVAKSQFAPDFTLRWGYMDMPGNMQNAWMGRVGISVPLWSLSKQRFGLRESRALLARAQSLKEAAVLNAEADVKSVYARLMAAKKTISIYEGMVIPRVRMLLSSSQEAYKSSKGDFLSIVDSVRSLNNAQLMLVRAKTDAAQAYADLERAVGTKVDMEEQ